jgi:hypothetical protein
MLAATRSFARRRPVLTAASCLSARYAFGDSVTQLTMDQRETLDLRRLTCFTCFGFAMGGGPVYAWFSWLMPRYIAPRLTTTFQRCAVFIAGDLGVMLPFTYLPSFYAMREFLYHPAEPAQVLHSAYAKWREGVLRDVAMNSLVAIPQDVAMQTVVPTQWRVPFVALTGLVWVGMLSYSRGAEGRPAPEAEQSAPALEKG